MTVLNGHVTTAETGPTPTPPDPEVLARARRRQFTGSYKVRILEEADACSAPGQLGALLRREGLYSSHLVDWRRQRVAGTLAALTPRRRGRPAGSGPAAELIRLRHENEQLTRRLATAETIIEIQKKVSTLLGVTPPSADGGRPR
jgi:transposase-like protein